MLVSLGMARLKPLPATEIKRARSDCVPDRPNLIPSVKSLRATSEAEGKEEDSGGGD